MLYHYTDYDKFESIIKSKELGLTRVIKSNYSEEVVRTYRIIWPMIRENLSKMLVDNNNCNKVLKILDEQMKLEDYLSTNSYEEPYVLCLTSNLDLVHSWQEYGDKGKGVCLAFSDELFNGIQNEKPHPNSSLSLSMGWDYVFYGDKELVDKLSIDFVDILNENKSAIGWLIIRTTLKHYSVFVKNPTFRDEREVRIVYYPDPNHVKDEEICLKSFVKDNEIPHCSIPWIKPSGICALKEIIIGNNCVHSIQDVERFLLEQRINNISVKKSNCSYTISQNR